MPNLVEETYGRTGRSTNTDAQHLLIKAPPAAGWFEKKDGR